MPEIIPLAGHRADVSQIWLNQERSSPAGRLVREGIALR